MDEYFYHKPVMLNEVERLLINNTSGIYADCTLGGGGHSSYLLNKHPRLKILGIDFDNEAIKRCQSIFKKYVDRINVIRDNFINLNKIIKNLNFPLLNGVLIDLGVSSKQLEDPMRGFSFNSHIIDMRMDDRLDYSAQDIINTLDFNDLNEIISIYGEERFSKHITKAIIEERKKGRIHSGIQLSSIIEKIKKRTGKTHPATKVFQAIRIKVNNELYNLENFLQSLPEIIAKKGRVVIISYHSLEDRIVKNNFRNLSKMKVYKMLNKKVITPSLEEIKSNPRSRSAKIRAVEKC